MKNENKSLFYIYVIIAWGSEQNLVELMVEGKYNCHAYLHLIYNIFICVLLIQAQQSFNDWLSYESEAAQSFPIGHRYLHLYVNK